MKLSDHQRYLLHREKRRFLVFYGVMLFIKFAPPLFSFSGASSIYQDHYENVLPIGFIDVLMIVYVIRLVFWFINFLRHKAPPKRQAPTEIFSDGY